MSALFSGPPSIPTPPPPNPPANPPTLANAQAKSGGSEAARAAAAASGSGFADTIKTGPQGTGDATGAAPAGKQTLGGG